MNLREDLGPPSQPGGANQRTTGSRWVRFARLAISALLLAWAWNRVDPNSVSRTMLRADPRWLLASFGVLLAERLVTIAKWWLLLRPLEPSLTFRQVLGIYWPNNFLGFFLPTGVGLDLLNARGAVRSGIGIAPAMSSVTLDRAMSLFALGAVVLFSLLLTTRFMGELTGFVLGIAILFMIVATLMSKPGIVLAACTSELRSGSVHRRLRRFHVALMSYRAHWLALLLNAGLSLTMQLLRVLEVVFISHALGLNASVRDVAAVVPAANALSALPFSVAAGTGLRENAYLYLFPQVGVGADDAIAISVIVLAWVVAWIIPGGLWGVVKRRSSQGPQSRSGQ